ncbi:hypothetical protein C0995_002909 [Termitomyces sp. Mi166|nr:hypothetical protein C0995_002909 [Termitomyces sp. Mi166\
MIATELNYDIYDKEFLVIVEAFKQWSDVCSKKSFEVEGNTFNQYVVISLEHLNSVLLLNKEGLLQQIYDTSPDDYVLAHKPQNPLPDTSLTSDVPSDNHLSSSPFSLSSNGKLLLHNGLIYVPNYPKL